MAETIPGIDEMLGINESSQVTAAQPVHSLSCRPTQSPAMQLGSSQAENIQPVIMEPIPGIDSEILEITASQIQGRVSRADSKTDEHLVALRRQALFVAWALHTSAIDRLTESRAAGIVPEPVILPEAMRSPRILTQDPVITMGNAVRRIGLVATAVAGNSQVYALGIAK